MGKAIYTGVSGVARNVTQPYIGVGGVSRQITNGYIGVNGVARQFFNSGIIFENGAGNITVTQLNYTSDASKGPHARIDSGNVAIYDPVGTSSSTRICYGFAGLYTNNKISLDRYSSIKVTFCGAQLTTYPAKHYMFIKVGDTIDLNRSIERIYRYNYSSSTGEYNWESWEDTTMSLDISSVSGEYYIKVGYYCGVMEANVDVMYIKKVELIE